MDGPESNYPTLQLTQQPKRLTKTTEELPISLIASPVKAGGAKRSAADMKADEDALKHITRQSSATLRCLGRQTHVLPLPTLAAFRQQGRNPNSPGCPLRVRVSVCWSHLAHQNLRQGRTHTWETLTYHLRDLGQSVRLRHFPSPMPDASPLLRLQRGSLRMATG